MIQEGRAKAGDYTGGRLEVSTLSRWKSLEFMNLRTCQQCCFLPPPIWATNYPQAAGKRIFHKIARKFFAAFDCTRILSR
jgi:hypothetical protein